MGRKLMDLIAGSLMEMISQHPLENNKLLVEHYYMWSTVVGIIKSKSVTILSLCVLPYDLEVALPLEWLPTKAKESRLAYYLTHSWKF